MHRESPYSPLHVFEIRTVTKDASKSEGNRSSVVGHHVDEWLFNYGSENLRRLLLTSEPGELLSLIFWLSFPAIASFGGRTCFDTVEVHAIIISDYPRIPKEVIMVEHAQCYASYLWVCMFFVELQYLNCVGLRLSPPIHPLFGFSMLETELRGKYVAVGNCNAVPWQTQSIYWWSIVKILSQNQNSSERFEPESRLKSQEWIPGRTACKSAVRPLKVIKRGAYTISEASSRR